MPVCSVQKQRFDMRITRRVVYDSLSVLPEHHNLLARHSRVSPQTTYMCRLRFPDDSAVLQDIIEPVYATSAPSSMRRKLTSVIIRAVLYTAVCGWRVAGGRQAQPARRPGQMARSRLVDGHFFRVNTIGLRTSLVGSRKVSPPPCSNSKALPSRTSATPSRKRRPDGNAPDFDSRKRRLDNSC